MVRRKIEVAKGCALRSQPAAELVRAACEFEARVRIVDGDKTVNAKSMMGVLSLGTPQTDALFIETEGADEAPAAEKLLPLVRRLYQG